MASAENPEENGSTFDPALTGSQPDNPDGQSEAPNARVLNPQASTTSSAKPQTFAELSRLAQESKSSWQANVPGRKADRDFLLLIIMTILLLLGIMLVGGYREPIAAKLNVFKEELTGVKNAVFPDTEQAIPSGNTNVELLSKITQLEATVSDLRSRIRSLEAEATTSVQASLDPSNSLGQTNTLNSGEPLAARQQEPLASLKQEPLASLKQEPSAVPKQEPSAVLKQKSSPVPVKQPVALQDKDSSSSPSTPDPQQTPVIKPEAAQLPAPLGANWFINIGAYSKRSSAENLLVKVQTVIANAAIQEIVVQDKTLYRIRATGYTSRSDAELDAKRVQSSLGLGGTWIATQNE